MDDQDSVLSEAVEGWVQIQFNSSCPEWTTSGGFQPVQYVLREMVFYLQRDMCLHEKFVPPCAVYRSDAGLGWDMGGSWWIMANVVTLVVNVERKKLSGAQEKRINGQIMHHEESFIPFDYTMLLF